MTTRDKGITLQVQFSYTDVSTALGYKVTDVSGDYTSKNAWIYGPASSYPVNITLTGTSAPADFLLQAQNASAGFANVGGAIKVTPGVGSVANASGNLILKDTAGNGGAWNTSHFVQGIYHLWMDAAGRLRSKSSTPANDTDGIVAGFDLVGSAVYDPPSLAAGVGATTTIAVAGAVLGDFAIASFSLDLQGITVTAYISAPNVVSIRFQNGTAGALDLASGTLRVKVIKQ